MQPNLGEGISLDGNNFSHHIELPGIRNWRDPCIGAFSALVLERGPDGL